MVCISLAAAGHIRLAKLVIRTVHLLPGLLIFLMVSKTYLLALAFLAGNFLLAQTTLPSLSTTADDVVVTAGRLPRPVEETTTKVTVIDSASIARHTDLGQLLNEQAGVVVNGAYSNPGQNRSLFLRNGGDQYTLILLDGQPLVDPSALNQLVDLRALDLSGIERIEIVRGAQSLLYGSNAVAGVVNLISKKGPSAKPLQADFRGSFGSWNTVALGATVRGTTELGDYFAGYDFYDTRGFSAALQQPDVGGQFDDDGARRQTFAAGVTIRPVEGLSIRPALRYAEFDYDFDSGAFADGDQTASVELITSTLAVDYATGNLQVGGRYSATAANRAFPGGFVELFRGRIQQGDVFGSYQLDKLAMTLGAQLRTEELRLEDPQAEEPDATTVSPYLQAVYTPTEKLTLEGGARFNSHSQFGGQFNYSAGAAYAISDQFRVLANVSSAFRSPTLDELFGPFGANAELNPQTSRSYELGLAVNSTNGKYQFTTTAFRREVDELIQFVNFTLGYQNSGDLRDLGIELEATAKITTAISAMGNFTYVSGELTADDGMGGSTVTDEFFRRPRSTGFLALHFAPALRRNTTTNRPLLLRLSANYSGERPDIFFNPDFTSTELTLDPFLLVNAYAEYTLEESARLTLFGEVRNLTDTDFVEVSGFTTQGTNVRFGFRLGL